MSEATKTPTKRSPPPATTSTSNTSGGHKRQRARNACLACRRRKRKCDTQYPCSMCTNYGYRCEYPKDDSPVAPFVDHPATSPAKTSPTSGNSVMNVRSIIASETSPQAKPEARVVETGILDPFKSRYVNQNSTVAFPRALGVDLQSAAPLPLHSYGWNCGIRPEEKACVHSELRDMISYDAYLQYSEVYFSTVAPIFSFLDRQTIDHQAQAYWTGAPQDLSQNCIIGGIIALGSFFSHNAGHHLELDIVAWVKRILDDPQVGRLPTVDRIIAWILRSVYLRATTRPHVSWLSSTVTLHLAEATGIHHEVQTLRLTTDDTYRSQNPLTTDPPGAERARKVFWLAWSFNKMISYEYGRSAVHLSCITCAPVTPKPGEHTVAFIQLAQQLPTDGDPDTPSIRKVHLHDGLQALAKVDDDNSEYLCLTKGDIALCYYRRLRMLDHGIEKSAVTATITFGRNAAAAALRLAEAHRPWWQVLGTVFQYICVLIAIDTAESLREVKSALEILERIASILDTHLAREALSTARILVRDSARKKRMELELLDVPVGNSNSGGGEGGEGANGRSSATAGTGAGEGGVQGLDEGMEVNVNWEEFFDPTLSGAFWEIPDFGTENGMPYQ